MSPIGAHRSAPPSDALRDLHRRLSPVLAELTFPVQRWQLIAAAELYGADTVTRSILERAPEQRFGSIPEVVAVVGAALGGRPVSPVPSPATAPSSAPRVPAPRAVTDPVARRTPRPAA